MVLRDEIDRSEEGLFEPAPQDLEKGPEIEGFNLTRLVYEGVEGEKHNTLTTSRVNLISPKKAYFQCHQAFQKWLYLDPPDREAIDVALAAAIDRNVPGDPAWFFIIAPSGGMKTELLRSLGGYGRVYTLSSLTPKTFISGKLFKDPETGKPKIRGLLPRIDGRVLVIKDFTVILSMRDVERYEIFGQLRDIHDGKHEKAFGNIDFTVRVNSKIGLIAGVTPAIDMHQKMATMLGERFLKIRQNPHHRKTAERAHENLGKEEEMREQLKNAASALLNNLDFEKIPALTGEQSAQIIRMAGYVSLMRAWVFCKYYQGRIVDLDIPNPEVPTRAAKQLGKLAQSLALVRGHDTVTVEDMNTVRRVARDTALPKRQRLVNAITKHEIPQFTHTDLAGFSKMHENTVNNECQKMVALGILEAKIIREVTLYKFTKSFKNLAESVRPRNLHGTNSGRAGS